MVRVRPVARRTAQRSVGVRSGIFPVVATVDVARLVARANAGEPLDFLFFWGHRAARPGASGPWFLSQWWPAEFTVDGIRYRAAEHFMMAAKARLFGDHDSAERITASVDPASVKRLGRGVSGFDENVWRAARYDIVRRGNLAKFSQNPALARYLVDTGDAVIAEASPVDSVWGTGVAADHPSARIPAEWPGLNLLGFVLMEVRDELAGR
jgi:ribA/ribD-fused uncharacterized protein